MSIKVMSKTWDALLPRPEKFILLAYADRAADDGTSVFPAISTIATKTSYEARAVQMITRKLARPRNAILDKNGYIKFPARGPLMLDDGMNPEYNNTNQWIIDVKELDKLGGANYAPMQKKTQSASKNAPYTSFPSVEEEETIPETINSIWEYNTGIPITQGISDKLEMLVEDWENSKRSGEATGFEAVSSAIDKAVENNARGPMKYIQSIIANWIIDGFEVDTRPNKPNGHTPRKQTTDAADMKKPEWARE